MTQDIRPFIADTTDLLGYGEPTHLEPGFATVRNELFAQLVEHGFRSIALETDRVAALAVDDYVTDATGSLDAAMTDGFSHGFGFMETNRRLVAWMRDYNDGRPEPDRLTFHGFDASLEMMSAPSPRGYLEAARDYLGADLDLAELCGDDDRWSRTEALMDAARSPGATPEAERLRDVGEELLTRLYARAPELIARTSRAQWFRARTRLTAGLGLLRYHRAAARPGDDETRWNDMCATRDVLMADNLRDIRDIEAGRGPTLVFANNAHVKRDRSSMNLGPMTLEWHGAGAILAAVLGERYRVIVGSLGSSDAVGLAEPEPGTYEADLRARFDDWGLLPAAEIAAANVRTDPTPTQGYAPLDQAMLDRADAVMHLPRSRELSEGYAAYLADQRRRFTGG